MKVRKSARRSSSLKQKRSSFFRRDEGGKPRARLTRFEQLEARTLLATLVTPTTDLSLVNVGAPGHEVEFRKANFGMNNSADQADFLMAAGSPLTNNNVLAQAFDNGVSVINYFDVGGVPAFPGGKDVGSTAFGAGMTKGAFNNNAGDDNFAMHSSGYIYIPTAGDWNFSVDSDDGFRLLIGENNGEVARYDGGRGVGAPTTGTATVPTPGYYHYDLVWYQGNGGAAISFFGNGPGQPTNRLIGDTAGGGLAVVRGTSETSGLFIQPEYAGSTGTAAMPGSNVEFRKGTIGQGNLSNFDDLFSRNATADAIVTSQSFDNGVAVINYNDNGGSGTNPPAPRDVGSATFPSNPKGSFNDNAEDDNFGMHAAGFMFIPTPGSWSFNVISDDGFRLRIGTQDTVITQYNGGRGVGTFPQSGGSAYIPKAGWYRYQLDWFQGGGGAGVSLVANGPGQVADTLVGLTGSGIPTIDQKIDFVVPGTTGDDTFTVKRRDVTNIVNGFPVTSSFTDITLNGVTTSTPFDYVNSIVFNGNAGNDTFIVDYTAGNPLPASGITVNGNGQTGAPGDALQILGGAFNTATYNYLPSGADGHNGNIQLDPDGPGGVAATQINYTGLAPILNTGTAANVIFNLPAGDGNNQASLQDDGNLGNNQSQLISGNNSFEVTTFTNPTATLTINASNDGETIGVTAGQDTALNTPLTINGGTGADSFNITAQANFAISVVGNAPTAVPGDVLNYAGPTPATKTITGPNSGTITAGGVQAVTFAGIETLGTTPPGNLFNDTIDLTSAPFIAMGSQDGNRNTVRLQRDATGNLLQIFFDPDAGGASPEILVSSQIYGSVGAVNVIGGTDSDTLIVNHSNGLIGKVINFAGNGPVNAGEPNGDALSIVGTPAGLGASALETYRVGATEDAGTWVIDPDGSGGRGGVSPGPDGMVVNFTGLEPADSSTAVPQFDVVFDTADNDDISIVNGGLLSGVQSIQVTDNSSTFETFRFANKANVSLHLNGGADTARLNYTTASAGLAKLEVYGNGLGTVSGVAADDNATDQFILQATAAGVNTNLLGQGGSDLFYHSTTEGANLGNLAGTINITGGETPGGDMDYFALQDSNATGPDTVLMTNTSITGAAPATINYSEIEQLFFESTAGNDTINIPSTALGTSYFVTGDGGNDTYTVGNTAAGFATPGSGSLDAVLGNIMFSGESNPLVAAGVDTLNVDDSGTAALAGSATIDTVAALVVNLFPGFTATGDATVMTNFAPATIGYYHGAVGGTVPVPNNAIENLNVLASTGNDTIAVNATTATVATNINTRQGDDTVAINGDRLSAANTFQGFDGNDTFNLNIAAHLGNASVTTALSSVTIEGQAQNAAADSRDRVNINDNNAGFTRNLNYHYVNPASGDLDIEPGAAGLGLAGGLGLNLKLRTMETVIYTGVGANNDTVRVTGTAADDDLAIAPLSASAALVFRGGLPYLGTPPVTIANSRPGVAGGGTGPDILINGIAPAGILLDGAGVGAAPGGNRAIVVATSENPLTTGSGVNIFGFGNGILQPGLGANNAYDAINVSDAQVTINNNSIGALLPVNLVTASFLQTDPVPQRPGLIVNGGDEAVARPNGIADDFTVVISNNFNIQLNGNLPTLALGLDGLPVGDQVTLVSPTSFNIFSDKATPPNVSITAGNSPFGVVTSSIERTLLQPGNGVVNLIGDNNDPAVDQTDNFVVVGRNVVDPPLPQPSDAGYQEMTVSVNGSPPILVNGVQFLNSYGFDLQGVNLDNPGISPQLIAGGPKLDVPATGTMADDIDTLDIRAYADNTPRGWGVHVNWNEGVPPATDGDQQDLLIYRTTLFGGPVSEGIVVAPSAPDAGQVFANNSSTNTPIVVIDYLGNTDIRVLDDDGFESDTDTLTLRGTDPATAFASGNDTVVADFTKTGDAANPIITVNDGATPLYRVQTIQNIRTVTFDLLGGNDAITVLGQNNGTPAAPNTPVAINNLYVLGGAGNDTLTLDDSSGLSTMAGGVTYDGGQGLDALRFIGSVALASSVYTVGPNPDEGNVVHTAVGVGGATQQVNFKNLEPIVDLIAAGTATVNATNGDNAINYTAGTVATNGRVTVDAFESYEFSNKTTLVINGLAGNDTINLNNPTTPNALTGITVNGGDPTTNSDKVIFNGTTGADAGVYTPTGPAAATITGVGPAVTIATTEAVTYNGLGGADTLTINGTAVDDTFTINPANGGAGSHASNAAPAFNYVAVPTVTINGGAGGFDLATVNGTEGPDTFTSAAAALLLTGGGTTNFGASIERLDLNLLGGNDNATLTALAALTPAAGNSATYVYGGAGDDTIRGTGLIDTIYGGSGNDILIGGIGNDFLYGEDGNDIFGNPTLTADGAADDPGIDTNFGGAGVDNFIWEPGDGADINNGGDDGGDIFRFFGNATPNSFTLQPGANPTHLSAIIGATTIDNAGIEQVIVDGQGGGDNYLVNDLYPTEVKAVNLILSPAGATDAVTIEGRNVSDNVNINGVAGALLVTGLRYDIAVNGAVAGDNDSFIFNANGGNDVVTATDSVAPFFTSSNVAASNRFTINGGDGDDFLTGYGRLNGNGGNDSLVGSITDVTAAANQILDGGDGSDQLYGGNGDDLLLGGAGEDLMVGGLGNDTYDGGTDFDTILIQATSGNDRIDYRQNSPTQIQYEISNSFTPGVDGVVGGVGTETDTLVAFTVEEARIVAGAGDDITRVTQSDSLIGGQEAASLRVSVDGGSPGASDRLNVVDDGLGDTTIQRIGGTAGEGSYTIGALAPVVYTGVEYASLTPLDPVTGATGTDKLGKLFVFKHDPYESNDSRLNATFIGSAPATNLDPVIDPGTDTLFDLPGDEDWYRIVADKTGTLDLRVFFNVQGKLANNRAGLPGDGDLDLELYDADGTLIVDGVAGGVTPEFGLNDTTNDERIRIPAVEGQTYYLRVRGAPIAAGPNASPAINVYSLSVLNTPTPIPFDLELDDVIAVGTVQAGSTATSVIGDASLSAVDDFYNGKDVYFTSGTINGQRGRVVDYIGATRTFVFAANTFTAAPAATNTFQIESIDTGRSQLDNTTRDNTPTIFIRVPDAALLNDIPDNGTAPGEPPDDGTPIPIPFVPSTATNAPSPGFRVAVFVTENDTHNPVLAGYAQPVAGKPGVYAFTFPSSLGPDGSYFISSRVEMIDPALPEQAQGFGDFAQSLEIVLDTAPPPIFFGLPNLPNDGLDPGSDSGIGFNQPTLVDNITNVTQPKFFGQAEANAVVRLFVDAPQAGFPNGNGIFEPGIDFQIGATVAQPYDGTNQYPTGYWEVTSNVNLNAAPFTVDGLRTIFASAEDVAGNINPAGATVEKLQLFIDTQGPQVWDPDAAGPLSGVHIQDDPATVGVNEANYDLFDPKPSTDGPTPLAKAIVIEFRDLPLRVAQFLNAVALKPEIALTPGNYQVKGDYNGIIPIQSIAVVNDPVVAGQQATGRVTLTFFSPLPDDRYTLTVSDNLTDWAGNHLDGESNASEPQELPHFPSGDGVPGGDFVARFTIDTRPEIGTWASGSVYVDTNGNNSFDPNNLDYTNRDITYLFGFTSDDIFNGNFVKDPRGTADGFDKLAAYGRVGQTDFRWLVDTDNDGVPNINQIQPGNINGLPVAGNFDGNKLNGDEVGLFTGTTWHFDTNHNFNVTGPGSATLAWPVQGYGFVGDFDGDGVDDLGTFRDDVFSIDLSSIDNPAKANVFPGIDGTVDVSFKANLGIIGTGDLPVVADMNRDGYDDIGLWIPKQSGADPTAQSEFYFLVSGVVANDTPNANVAVGANIGPAVVGPAGNTRVVTTAAGSLVQFQPVPFGNDFRVGYGDPYAMPLVGNFDPPKPFSGSVVGTNTNHSNNLDVDGDGFVTALDALIVINQLNSNGASQLLGSTGGPYVDVDADGYLAPLDSLLIVNWLNAHNGGIGQSQAGGEGEAAPADDYFASLGDSGDDTDLLLALALDGSSRRK